MAEVMNAPVAEEKDDTKLLRVENLKQWFPLRTGILSKITNHVKAVDGISFDINKGETFGLVGESGCGKTTTGRAILRLYQPTSGSIFFEGKDILKLSPKEMHRLRREMQIVFQDPFSSLNPRMTVESLIGESLIIHNMFRGQKLKERVHYLLDVVGLQKNHANRYPHEFSGGQRQRICVAQALSLNPKLIICDEPVSALDVSIQSQIINLFEDLQEEFKLTYLFISHDLSVVNHICDHVGVMYLGKIVEVAPKATLYESPMHPYTEALLSAIPIPNPKDKREKIVLEGDVGNPINPPSGCRFHTRCSLAEDICKEEEPVMIQAQNKHYVSCHMRKRKDI